MTKMHMLKSATDTINTSFIIESEKGLIIFDGGFHTESETLSAKVKSLDKKIVAWFLTHPHTDHIDCFRESLKKHPDFMKPETLYYNFPSVEIMNEYLGDSKENGDWLQGFYDDIAPFSVNTVICEKDDVYSFGDVTVRVLRVHNDATPNNFSNNSSTVYRLETENSSVIFLGDLGVEGGEHLLTVASPELLKADYCQMAHHGQQGVEKDVYEARDPDYCLWCTPTWLWDNKGPEGYDTGKYKTVIVRGWMSEIKIKKHYIMQEGPFEIEL